MGKEGCFLTGLPEKASLMRSEQHEIKDRVSPAGRHIPLNKENTCKSLRTKARGSCPCLSSGRMATGAESSDTKEGMRSQCRR